MRRFARFPNNFDWPVLGFADFAHVARILDLRAETQRWLGPGNLAGKRFGGE